MADYALIAGRYRVEARLGVGGMSTVHLAFDERLERYVAVKLLAEHLADDPAFISRFRREALAAARLVHPNIVQVFDFGLDEHQHQQFIVMEHVSGHSCAELLRDLGPMEVEHGVDVISQACRGLEYAHRHGVVHRDVKPGNLLVSDDDVVKLADFGIARATDQSSITQVGSVLGTAAYLAPEQARGEEAGPRADIYSLGVVAYQLLSGRLPYEATSLSELTLKQQRELPQPLSALNPDVPPELAQAVAVALSIDQEQRPGDALNFAEMLRDGYRGRAPDTGATGVSTRATRVLGGAGAPTSATRVASRTAATPAVPVPAQRLQPRAAPVDTRARRPPATRPAQARPAKRRGGGALAVFGLLILVIAVVVVAVILATSGTSTVVHASQVVAHDFSTAFHKFTSLINKYTK